MIRFDKKMLTRRKKVFCICGFGFLALVYFILYEKDGEMQRGSIPLEDSWSMEEMEQEQRGLIGGSWMDDDKLVVLIWTLSWGEKPFGFLSSANQDCPQCHFTHDRSQFNKSSALLFYANHVKPNDVPTRVDWDQVWVFLYDESPYPSKRDWPSEYDTIYNWTMTYRTNSDVYIPYGKFIQTDHPTPTIPIPSIHNFHNRSMVAWINSHCYTPSRRETVAKGLQRHIPVDIYGGCEDLKCPTPRKPSIGKDCRRHIQTHYKFYLAFEHSLCVDYVTEKYFDTCKTEMIPVVYGGTDYAALFPPKSFINARDFGTVAELANHMKLVGSNASIWLEYFEYRKKYTITGVPHLGFCDLCQKLVSRANRRDTSRKVVNNVSEYWAYGAKDGDGNKICDDPRDVPIYASLNLKHQ